MKSTHVILGCMMSRTVKLLGSAAFSSFFCLKIKQYRKPAHLNHVSKSHQVH